MSDLTPSEGLQERLAQLPPAGQNKWADRYAVDVPNLLAEIQHLRQFRDVLDELVAPMSPLDVKASVTDGQFALWLEDPPIHAIGTDLTETEEQFLDALTDYAEDWYTDLHRAPNHAANWYLALHVTICDGDREELRRVVFGED